MGPELQPVPEEWELTLRAVLRKRRRDLGLSQQDVGNLADMSQNVVWLWDNGHGVTLASFAKWTTALGLRPSDVLRRTGL